MNEEEEALELLFNQRWVASGRFVYTEDMTELVYAAPSADEANLDVSEHNEMLTK